MSALPPSLSNKPWWSRSRASKDGSMLRSSHPSLGQDTRAFPAGGSSKQRDGSGSRFNTFVASAMGKKPKKPTLMIQDPPSLVTSPSSVSSFSPANTTATSPVSSTFFASRPHVQSMSAIHSYEFDQRSDPYTVSEPRTPSDHPRDRRSYQNSVLTMSDPDPFAAGGIIVPSIHQDPIRLSVWSDSSLLDPHVKKHESSIGSRVSYASSSSHGNHTDAQSNRGSSSAAVPRRPSESVNVTKRRRREASLMADSAFTLNLLAAASATVQGTTVSAPPSSAPSPIIAGTHEGTFSRRPSTSEKQPLMRTRGMTVAGERPGTSNSSKDSPLRLHRQASESHLRNLSKSTISTASPVMFSSARSSLSNSSMTQHQASGSRPLVLVRKASSSRIHLPPLYAAPPTTRLPPPPLSPFTSDDDGADADSFVLPDPVHSSSSSSLSFASIEDFPDEDALSFLAREVPADEPVPSSPSATGKSTKPEVQSRQLLGGRTDSTILGSGYPLPASLQLLKKAPSEHNMEKRVSEVSLLSALSVVSDDMNASSLTASGSGSNGTKALRKQRSFHHPRIPLPPLPTLRHASSYNSNANADASSSKPLTPPTSPPAPTRRRLFSSPTVRRTSSGKAFSTPPSTADEDVRSLFSLSLSFDGGDSASRESAASSSRNKLPILSFANMGNQMSIVTDNACISPTWEEFTRNPISRKRASHADYIPQRIMSPAAMLKLEEQLAGESACHTGEQDVHSEKSFTQEESERRPRLDLVPGDFGMSFVGQTGRTKSVRSRTESLISNMSAATMAFGADKSVSDERSFRGIVGIAQAIGTRPRRPSTVADSRSSLWSGLSLASPTSSTRPATAQPNLSSPPISPISQHSPQSELSNGGLSPPPRPRVSREKQRDSILKRASIAPMQPLSPPPQRRPTRSFSVHDDDASGIMAPTPQSSRPPSAFGQKLLNRRSIMKKPSFLEIDDEWDDTDSLIDKPVDCFPASRPIDIDVESSFLDLDRGNSIDTIRSCDEEFRFF